MCKLSWLALFCFEAAKYEIQKPSTCRATLFRCKFLSMFPVIHLVRSTWPATKTLVAGWRKLLRKVQRRPTSSNKFWLCCSFFIELTTCRATNSAILDPPNQPSSALHSLDPHQMFLLRAKLMAQGEKRETSTKTCNETMLRDKLRVFVSCISPRLRSIDGNCNENLTWNSTFGKWWLSLLLLPRILYCWKSRCKW